MNESFNPRRALKQALKGWQLAGVTSLPPAVALPEAAPPESSPETSVHSPLTSHHSPAVNQPSAISEQPETMPKKSTKSQSKETQLEQLKACVAKCTRCQELAETRTQTVFGVGNPHAKVMFVGEAPGADEDQQGEPFVGKAGQLLNKIIEACGWKREDLYICNILRCRPPGNRLPGKDEAANCREYLDGQISIVDPKYIVCWGSCAAQNLLNSTESIGKMRKQLFNYGNARVLCTYHPAYLLRNPAAKKDVWDDLKFLMKEMEKTGDK